MGLAFGFRNVVIYSLDRQAQVDSGRSLNRQAVADGKPTVLIEMGENGRRDAAFVEPLVEGILNAAPHAVGLFTRVDLIHGRILRGPR